MEVETNYTCLAFQGWKATMVKTPPEEVDAESWLMEALAKFEEDKQLDYGEVEIPSDEEFIRPSCWIPGSQI